MTYTKINKRQARKLHDTGITVYCLPCKVRVDNMWIKPCRVLPDRDFDKFVNEYSFYNCNSCLGKILAWYKEA